MNRLLGLLVRLNILWALCSPLLVAWIFNHASSTPLFFALKDLLLYLTFVASFVVGFRREGYVALLFTVLFVVYTFLNYLFLNPGYEFPEANIRQIISPLLLVILGVYVPLNEAQQTKILKFTYRWVVLAVIVGVLFLLSDVWSHFSLKNYFLAKGIPVDARGVSYMFYEPIISYRQRMVGTMLDPISLGHTLAAVFTVAWYRVDVSGHYRFVIIMVTGVGMLLTFSKGAMLLAFLSVVMFNPKIWASVKFLGVSAVGIVVASLPNKEGLKIHVLGAWNAIETATLFGFGLGAVGNYAKMFMEDLSVYEAAGISDTYIGSMLGQLGVIGLVFWFAIMSFVLRQGRWAESGKVAWRLIVATLVVAVLSENSMNFTSFAIPGILVGLLVQRGCQLHRTSV